MFPVATTAAVRYPPFATWALIALNVLVYVLIQMPLLRHGGPAAYELFLKTWGLVPAAYFGDAAPPAAGWWPFLTNMFLHGGVLHLGFNMWTLYIFGPAVEDRFGSGRFVALYLLFGLAASLAHAAANADSAVPAIGASGAIAGVTGAYMRLFPRSLVVVLVPILFYPLFFELPAAAFAAFWFATQFVQGVFSLFLPANVGGIAWWAHIGGFVAGLLVASIYGGGGRRHRALQCDEGRFGCRPDGARARRPWHREGYGS